MFGVIKVSIAANGRIKSKILRALKESGIDYQVVEACAEAVRICSSSEVQELVALALQPAGRQRPNFLVPIRKKGKGKVQKYMAKHR